MSLKAIHITAMSLSAILFFGFSLWAVRHSNEHPSGGGILLLAVVSFIAGAAAVYYLFWFLDKIRKHKL